MPEFIPMKCSSCQKIIRGCSFSNTGSKATTTVCETCYTTSHRHEEAWIKTYKHCVLDDITPEDSWTACQCTDISKVDANGNKRSLIPVQPEDSHVESINGSSKCGILQLPQLVAEAKYKGMLSEQEAEVVSARKHGFRQSFRSTDKLAQRREQDIKAKVARNLRDQEKASPTHAAIGTVIVGTPPALLVREDDDLEPYRRMNMALRIGPLVIENICRE